ncbi:hypothetical protein BaRGS_00024856 [Batillaria attramentaria]|uniref:DNA polymerase n=1 Tax=Batillaria attramentaria TaxID=370345 RepID=A0ABD0KA71_9CAEN
MAQRKRTHDVYVETLNPNRAKRQKRSSESASASPGEKFLCGTVLFLLPAGIQKTRLQLFKTQVAKYGGLVEDSVTDRTTHFVVDDSMTVERMCKIMKIDTPPLDTTVVKSAWLSACFRAKEKVDCDSFKLDVCSLAPGATPTSASDSKGPLTDHTSAADAETESRHHQFPKVGVMWNAFKPQPGGREEEDVDSDYVPSDDDQPGGSTSGAADTGGSTSTSADTTPNTSPEKKLPVGKWICAQSSKAPKANLNEHITSKLEDMVKNYESTNDKWRAFGYQKAIAALRKHPKEITSWEEARSLQGVGSKLADKIWEIAQSGELRKLNEFQSSEEIQVLKLFTDVWGAGPTTARTWYQQGFRTLEDLKTKANLTHQQKVGVRIYDDLLDRMPREEATEIGRIVHDAAEAIQPGILTQVCGSYRRGKADCGDVDVLVTHPDGHSEKGIFAKLVQRLKDTGFLTDDLVSVEDNGNQKKYLGVCKLPGVNRKHRRLDIIVVPYEEYACALVYFTGSAHFNRSLRHLCKKMGMSLNEHALKKGVVRKGAEKIYEGTTVPTPTEESVFTALGVPFRPPEERDH